MSVRLIYSESARQDLGDVYDGVVSASFSPESAREQVRRIRERIRALKIFPQRYPKYDESRYGELRFFPVDNYLVFYRPEAESSDVVVARVLYGGIDIRKYPSSAFED